MLVAGRPDAAADEVADAIACNGGRNVHRDVDVAESAIMPAVADVLVAGSPDAAADGVADTVSDDGGWNVDANVQAGAECILPSISHDYLLVGVAGARMTGPGFAVVFLA